MKKKIIIFTSSGGGGHTSTTAALTSCLKHEFEVKPVFIFAQVLGLLDPGNVLSFGKFSGENVYNFCIRKKWNSIASLMYQVGNWYFKQTRRKNQELIRAFLEKEKPDALISVAPLIINRDILAVAQKLNIPFVLVPTDLDTRTFTPGIETSQYEGFKCSAAFNDRELLKKLTDAISHDAITITGFPIRQAFFEHKDKDAIKTSFNVPKNKPVIFLLMGAVGIDEIVPFTEQLKQISTPAHLLIGIGKNEKLREKIEHLTFPKHITYTIIGFTDKIADLMAISDLLVTKSGTVSFCEGLYMNVPILLDGTSSVLLWEKFNHEFLERHGFGKVIKTRDELSDMVDDLLKHPEKLERMKKNLKEFPKQNGCEQVKKLVLEMIK